MGSEMCIRDRQYSTLRAMKDVLLFIIRLIRKQDGRTTTSSRLALNLIQKKRLEKAVKDNPGEKAYLDKYFKAISDYMAKSETELSKPAICMWHEEERFEKFVEEGTKGSFIAIKPNLDYYNNHLPKSSPQFFTVIYKISKDDAVFIDNIEAIKKATFEELLEVEGMNKTSSESVYNYFRKGC